MLRRCVSLVPLMMLPAVAAVLGAEADIAADEETLRAANISADEDSLLRLFRQRTPDEKTRTRIRKLIKRLGDDEFTVREQASAEVATLGVAAMGPLRQATHHSDLEIRNRVRRAIALIQKKELSSDVLVSAMRVLAQRKPRELSQVLLDYLPYAGSEEVADEVRLALTAVAPRDGEADPLLVRALTDKLAVKRGAAGAALCRGGCREQFAAVRRLLRDPDLLVRQRVGLALVEKGDKAAVPVLIELLAQLPSNDAEPIESLLVQLAGDAAPKGSLDARGKYRDAWAEWWKQHSDGLDLAKIELAPHWRGYTLAVCKTKIGGRGWSGYILELDAQGRTRWQMKGLSQYAVDAQVLDEKRVLVTEYNPAQVTERNHKGDILRRIHVSGKPLEARRLPNGNTLITTENRVCEIDRNDKEVWGINVSGGVISAACPLRGGEVGICRLNNKRGAEFLRLDRKGNVLASFRVGRMFCSMGTHIQGLPNGHILVPQYLENKVVEFDKNGREVWSASCGAPTCAQRLPNGRTLVASSAGFYLVELDKKGREVKRKDYCLDLPTAVRRR